jgi:hypothetical protein
MSLVNFGKYWRQPLEGGFPSCFKCQCPALKSNLIVQTFAAEQSMIPECAKKALPPETLYVVSRYVCLPCAGKINRIANKFKEVFN